MPPGCPLRRGIRQPCSCRLLAECARRATVSALSGLSPGSFPSDRKANRSVMGGGFTTTIRLPIYRKYFVCKRRFRSILASAARAVPGRMHPLPLGSQRTPPRPRRDYITAEGRCTTEMLGRTAAALRSSLGHGPRGRGWTSPGTCSAWPRPRCQRASCAPRGPALPVGLPGAGGARQARPRAQRDRRWPMLSRPAELARRLVDLHDERR
jgi:hypothetical protein